MSKELTATFPIKKLSESGEQYVLVPREYQIVTTLPDGTTLLSWRPLDRFDTGYQYADRQADE